MSRKQCGHFNGSRHGKFLFGLSATRLELCRALVSAITNDLYAIRKLNSQATCKQMIMALSK